MITVKESIEFLLKDLKFLKAKIFCQQFGPWDKSETPKIEHSRAVEHLEKYLQQTKYKDIVMQQKEWPFLEVYVDTNFSENWNNVTA